MLNFLKIILNKHFLLSKITKLWRFKKNEKKFVNFFETIKKLKRISKVSLKVLENTQFSEYYFK